MKLINRIPKITYDEFITFKTFNNFNEKGIILNLDYKDYLVKFYKNYYSCENPILWMIDPCYNYLTEENKVKFLIVSINNDEVLLSYRRTAIFKTKFIKLIDIPLSLNNNDSNVKTIISHLLKLDFVRIMTKEKYLPYYEGLKNELAIEYSDFYFDLNHYKELFNNTKWRKKNVINRFENNNLFKIVISNNCDIENAIKLDKMWSNSLNTKYKTRVLLDKNFINCINKINNNVYYTLLYYKDILIALGCFEIIDNYALLFYVKHIGRNKNEIMDSYLHSSIQNLTNTLIYFMGKFLLNRGVIRLYEAGVMKEQSNQKLLEHKIKTTDGYVKYYNILI